MDVAPAQDLATSQGMEHFPFPGWATIAGSHVALEDIPAFTAEVTTRPISSAPVEQEKDVESTPIQEPVVSQGTYHALVVASASY